MNFVTKNIMYFINDAKHNEIHYVWKTLCFHIKYHVFIMFLVVDYITNVVVQPPLLPTMFYMSNVMYFIMFLVVNYITNDVVQPPLLPTYLTPHSYLS